jgi:type VI secretion system protein ImpE
VTPSELYQAGQLAAALDAALADVKQHPTDTQRRGLLCELLCCAGEWERADRQLDTITQQQPKAAVALTEFRQLIRAETARKQCFEEGCVPEFLAEPTPVLQLHLRASIAIRENQLAEAAQLLEQADELRVRPGGTCDGQAFDDLRDLDDLTSSFCEVLTSTGKYYWIPWETIESLEFEAPEAPRDLLWRRAQIVVTGGPEGVVFIPTLYPLTAATNDDQFRLARRTDWQGQPGEPVRGIGLRMLLVGEHDRTILQIQKLEFQKA